MPGHTHHYQYQGRPSDTDSRGQTNKNTRSNVTFPREGAPRLSFMTTIGDTNHQTEDGINLVTSGSVTITAGHTTQSPIGLEHGREACDWPGMRSDVSECLVFVEERRVSSVILISLGAPIFIRAELAPGFRKTPLTLPG